VIDPPDPSNFLQNLSDYNNIIRTSMPDLSKIMAEYADSNQASGFYKRLTQMISNFDNSLGDASEVGVRLVSFGQTVVFHLRTIGYWNPSLIIFSGHTEEGEPVHLIQHISQISILLMKLPRKDPKEPKRPIGFNIPEEQSNEKGKNKSG